ncbi:hypothetical protein TNCV_4027201 [Trichonephila clavipes]|nr:hypothetical protein TNCV_4027201 [Trichonephila clavipes]
MYPLHHGQNPYKIQTAPGYYYKTDELLRCFNKITTLRTSSLDVPPLHHGQNPYKIQTAPGYYYKTDELLRCFNKITTLQTFFSFSPIRTWTAVREPGVCESGVREPGVRDQESVTRSPRVPVERKMSLLELLIYIFLHFDMDIFLNEFFLCSNC